MLSEETPRVAIGVYEGRTRPGPDCDGRAPADPLIRASGLAGRALASTLVNGWASRWAISLGPAQDGGDGVMAENAPAWAFEERDGVNGQAFLRVVLWLLEPISLIDCGPRTEVIGCPVGFVGRFLVMFLRRIIMDEKNRQEFAPFVGEGQSTQGSEGVARLSLASKG